MTFEKLTYSGKKCKNYLYFSFDGQFFDVNKITEELKIQPTKTRIKKEPVPKATSWQYRIDAGKKEDLRDEISEIVTMFYPKIPVILKLKEDLGVNTRLQFVLDIDVNPSASTPCFFLNKKIIDFLGRTETEVDFDLYKVDTIGILDSLKSSN